MSAKTKKVVLKEAIEHDGQKYEVLFFRKMKTKDLKMIPGELFDLLEEEQQMADAAKQGNKEHKMSTKNQFKLMTLMLPVLAAIADVSEDVINEMDLDMFMETMEEVQDFLEMPQGGTGGK